jgi:hypothetical protein
VTPAVVTPAVWTALAPWAPRLRVERPGETYWLQPLTPVDGASDEFGVTFEVWRSRGGAMQRLLRVLAPSLVEGLRHYWQLHDALASGQWRLGG